MYAYDEEQLKSLRKVEETRAERTGKDLRRLTADEKTRYCRRIIPIISVPLIRIYRWVQMRARPYLKNLLLFYRARRGFSARNRFKQDRLRRRRVDHRRRRRGRFGGDRSETRGCKRSDGDETAYRRREHDDGGRRYSGGG